MLDFIKNINKKCMPNFFSTTDINNLICQNEQHHLDHINNNINFISFLKNSMLNPIINAPFTEENKKHFAFMENISSFLQTKVKDNSILCSIIMPCYNREYIIKESIESVLRQNYNNYELIIIDDKSTDNTINIIKEYTDKRIKLIKNETHLGCASSRNKGLSYSKGQYIFYLDSDNTWDLRYLKTMLGAFIYLNNCDAIYCGQYLFNCNSLKPHAIRFASFNISLLENRNYIDINCFAHSKHILKKILGFDENLKRLIDYDFILKISEFFTIYSIPVILSNYFFNKSNNTITNNENYNEAYIQLQNNKKLFHENITNKKVLNPAVSAIIPNYENYDDLVECVDSLYSAGCSEIIIIDNNSSITTQNKLNKFSRNKNIKLVQNKINYGFSYAVNQGFDIASQQNDILLANNDSIYKKDSLYELQKYAYLLKDCGLTVPRQILFPNTKTINIHVPYANNKIECDVNLSKIHNNIEYLDLFSNGKIIELNFAPFFCVYIKRNIFNMVGKLDAEHGRHYRSDRIYCNILRYLYKKKIYYISTSKVYHKLQKSTQVLKDFSPNQYDIMFKKNIWPDNLIKDLGFRQKLWDI